MLPPLKTTPIKDRMSTIFLEKGQVDVVDGSLVLLDEAGVRTQIPIGNITCIMLEPGTRISHKAVTLAARAGTLLVWCGEAGVRIYSTGRYSGARSDHLLFQAAIALNEKACLKVVRKMFAIRFREDAPQKRSIDQLRGMEGARVKKLYSALAKKHGVEWKGRKYDRSQWKSADVANQCLSTATSCLYGVTEAAILTAGYSPAIGFIHKGNPLSFVYDIADLIKFETVIAMAFEIAAANPDNPERKVRLACRDLFRKEQILKRLIPLIEEVLLASEINHEFELTEPNNVR